MKYKALKTLENIVGIIIIAAAVPIALFLCALWIKLIWIALKGGWQLISYPS